MTSISDPMEALIAQALTQAGVKFAHESDRRGKPLMDFFLSDVGVWIEVKQFHSERIAEQMSRASDVIAIQGRAAVSIFCQLISLGKNQAARIAELEDLVAALKDGGREGLSR